MNVAFFQSPSFKALRFLFWHLGVGAILFAVLLEWVPRYEKIFADLHTVLPQATQLCISIVSFAGIFGCFLFPVFYLADFGLLWGLYRSGRNGLAGLWGYLVLIALVVALLLTLESILKPLTEVVITLSNGRG